MKKRGVLKIDRWLSFSIALFLATSIMLAMPITSPAQVSVGVSITIAPPPLPVYTQPLCPGPGFIWIPGYWAWDPSYGYFWVPGMWAPAPFVGALWTPGYWAWNNGVYVWYEGYWGPVVGFYGGINYGFGYTGYGYSGGYWSSGRFYYNSSVNHINVTNITTVYNRPIGSVRPTGVSFNGGRGGSTARPSPQQLDAARQRRSALTSEQKHHMDVARGDPKQRASVNHGHPTIAATSKPGVFSGRGVVGSSRPGTPYRPQPGYRAVPSEHGQPPRPGTEMRPPVNSPERMAPGTPMRQPEQRFNEPRPAQRPPEANGPQRQSEKPRNEKPREEKEEMR